MTFFLYNSRASDGVLNVKDFGAKGDGSTIDTAAIRAAITAMYAVTTKSCILFFPPGNYIVDDTIDISNTNGGSIFTSGIICGSGSSSTKITGTLNNGFILSQTDGLNGPEEISSIGFANASTVIGTGCLLINNTSMRISGCSFVGMVNLLMPSNIYNVQIDSCTGSPNVDGTTGTTGTFGIAGGACNISGCRSTANFQASIQLGGGEPCKIAGNSNENPTVGLLLGLNAGWASSCTVASGANSAIMNVGGNLGSLVATKQFSDGSEIFMKGVTTVTDWGLSPLDPSICTIIGSHTTAHTITSYTYNSGSGLVTLTMQFSQVINPGESVTITNLNIAGLNGTFTLVSSSGTTITYTAPTGQAGSATGGGTLTESGLDGNNFAGHYRISRNVSVVSPVPCISRTQTVVASAAISGYSTEAAHYPIFALNTSNCTFDACGGSGTPVECVDAFGNTGFTAHSCFYLYNVVGCSFDGCGSNNNPYKAGWYFDPNKNQVCSLTSCTSSKLADNITGTSSSISNGSGSAGTILNVLSLTQGVAIGIGMRVFVSGSQVATVTGNHASNNTLTGGGGTGTYSVDISQHVTGTAITIKTGDDYILPTTDAGKTGVELFNTVPQFLPAGYTSGLNSLNRTFNSLPGQAGANNNIQVTYGMEYDIIDSTVATWSTTVAGGGTNKVRVRYNGTNWTVVGV